MQIKKIQMFESGKCLNCQRFSSINPARQCFPRASKLQCPLKGEVEKEWTRLMRKEDFKKTKKLQISLF